MDDAFSCLNQDVFVRSVVVGWLKPSVVDKDDIVIHFQSRKNGGGDINKVVMFSNGSNALVTFEDKKCTVI